MLRGIFGGGGNAGGQRVASLYAEIGADASGFKRGMQSVRGDLKTGESQFKDFASKSAMLLGGATAALYTLKKGIDFTKEGAQLEYARGRFDNLAASIHTTSDALMRDLRDATRGMVSDADLVASAGDLMALGLAKSHDEVLRLARVAGALNMNMNQSVLTLTNQTTMRFDALGVSVDGFEEKVSALEAAGHSTNEAFKLAFLEQAESQLALVGDVADTTAGSFARLENAWVNWVNELKQGAAEGGVGDFVDATVDAIDNMDLLESALDLGFLNRAVGGFETVEGEVLDMAEAFAYLRREIEELERRERLSDMLHEWGQLSSGDVWDDITSSTVDFANTLDGVVGSGEDVVEVLDDIRSVNHDLAGDIADDVEDYELWAAGIEEIGDAWDGTLGEMALAGATYEDLRDASLDFQRAAIIANATAGEMDMAEAREALVALGGSLETIDALLSLIDGRTVDVDVLLNIISNITGGAGMLGGGGSGGRDTSPQQLASGGWMDPEQLVRLGEMGEEWGEFVPGMGWYIHNAEEVRRARRHGIQPSRGLASGGALGGLNTPIPEGFQITPGGGFVVTREAPRTGFGGLHGAGGGTTYTPIGGGDSFTTFGSHTSGRGGAGGAGTGSPNGDAAVATGAAAAAAAAQTAAQSGAAAAAGAVAAASQQVNTQAFQTFSAQIQSSNTTLIANMQEMTNAIKNLPSKQDLKTALKEAVAEVTGS